MAIPTDSYESIFKKFLDSVEWMESIGVNTGSGRLSDYKKIVGYWTNSYKTASAEEAKKIFPEFTSSMFEIFDFVDIYESFKVVPTEELPLIVGKLQKAVSGPANAAEETPKSTAARNFLFEVTVAARAHRPDQYVKAILDAKSDTGISINGRKIWVECKRVTTTGKIERNVRKASNQLEATLKKQVGTGHRGIVALEVSKIFQDGDKIFVRSNDDELLSSVDQLIDQFIKEYSPIWQRVFLGKSRKIIGVIIRMSFMSTSESRNILVHVAQYGMNPRDSIPDNDTELQRSLASRLSGI